MKSKLLTQLMIGVGLMASATLANAYPMSLPGGPLYIQYNNAEQYSPTNSITTTDASGNTVHEGNWGILQVSSIQQGTALPPIGSDIQGGGTTVFTNGQNGGNQITGIFYGTQSVIDPVTGLPTGNSTGGVVDLYWQDHGTANVGTQLANPFNSANRPDQNTYLGFAEPNNPNFTFLGEFLYTPGCDGGGTNTVCSSVVPGTADGAAKSYQNVNLADVGAWTTKLNTNFFTLNALNQPMTPADLRTDSNFSANGASYWSVANTDIVGLRSNDPVRADAVPEPGSLALVGLGLVGLAYFGRRRPQGGMEA